MTNPLPSAKRLKYDLRATFDITVGKSPSPVERFTVHSDVVTKRSRFLCAARKPEWLTDATKPVDLTDEDPEVFQAYLNCVYFGPQTLRGYADEFERQMKSFNTMLCVSSSPKVSESSLLSVLDEFGHVKSFEGHDTYCRITFETADDAARTLAGLEGHIVNGHRFSVFLSAACKEDAAEARSGLSDVGCEALIRLYLLADKLQDLTTANTVMDELILFVAKTTEIPNHAQTSLAYNFTTKNSPLRTLLRDYWVYQMPSDADEQLEDEDFPKDFMKDIATELMRLKLGESTSEDCKRDKCADQCLYHQHDNEHPKCGAQ